MTAQECIPLYDFETAIETAIQSIVAANEIPAYTSQSAPSIDPPRPRPRVEIIFQCGPATGHRNPNTEVYRTDAFTGNCMLTLVTNTSDAESVDGTTNAGARQHAQFRAVVRYICATIESTLTDDANAGDLLLPFHSVNRFVESGSSGIGNVEEGSIASQLNFEVAFNIRATVWPA